MPKRTSLTVPKKATKKPNIPSGKVCDPEIRKHLKSDLLFQFPGAKIVDELNVCRCRVDIAVLSSSSGLVGYEIKSQADSLSRLKRQVTNYDKIFSFMYLVVFDNHYEESISIVPPYWGIIKVEKNMINGVDKGLYHLHVRSAQRNPRRRAYNIADLLWKQELIDVLISLGVPKRGLGSRTVRSLCDSFTQVVDIDRLEGIVVSKMLSRTSWRV